MFDWHKEAEKKWNDNADFWSERSKDMWDHGSRSDIVPFLTEYVEKGGTVADLGCGDGYGSYLVAQKGYHVTGLDLSKDMIEKANARLQNDHLSFVQGDLTNLPFDDQSFDALLAINSLEWTEVPARGLSEMNRVLKRGGHLCIGILGPTAMPRVNSYRRLFGEEVICNTMMPWELKKMAEETGWRSVDGKGVYKRGIRESDVQHLNEDLRQALTFMWLFMFEKQ